MEEMQDTRIKIVESMSQAIQGIRIVKESNDRILENGDSVDQEVLMLALARSTDMLEAVIKGLTQQTEDAMLTFDLVEDAIKIIHKLETQNQHLVSEHNKRARRRIW